MCFMMPSTSIVVFSPFTGAARRGRQGFMTTGANTKVKITITYLNHITFNNYSNICRSCMLHISNIICPFTSIYCGVWHGSWNYK